MTDEELADKVLALGVGYPNHNGCFTMNPSNDEGDEANDFVRDWRVAGALMEKCAKENSLDGRTIALSFGVDMFCATRAGSSSPTYGVYLERTDESAPRAIIEACVEPLT